MYLKNTSDRKIIMVSTVVGKIGLKPGEAVEVNHKLLPPINRNIKEITKEDYLLFRQGTEEIKKPVEEVATQDVEQFGQDTQIKDIETIAQEATKDLADNNVMEFISNLLATKFEENGEETDAKPLEVQETDSKNEVEALETQIEQLKDTWVKEKAIRKKDKISKQIKELQKQLDKLKKDTKSAK